MFAALAWYNARAQLVIEISETTAQDMETDGWKKIHRENGKAYITVDREQEVDHGRKL